MKKVMFRVFYGVMVCVMVCIGVISAHAYAIVSAGGFSPYPTDVYSYKGFAADVNSAISSSCAAWNAAGFGTLVRRASSTHSNTTFPLQNSANQVTAVNLGKNGAMMRTNLTSVSVSGLTRYNKEVDININTAYPWATSGDVNAFDVRNCFTHELGHLLGLGEEWSDTESTMYGKTAYGETKKRTLSSDDKNGLNTIYR